MLCPFIHQNRMSILLCTQIRAQESFVSQFHHSAKFSFMFFELTTQPCTTQTWASHTGARLIFVAGNLWFEKVLAILPLKRKSSKCWLLPLKKKNSKEGMGPLTACWGFHYSLPCTLQNEADIARDQYIIHWNCLAEDMPLKCPVMVLPWWSSFTSVSDVFW